MTELYRVLIEELEYTKMEATEAIRDAKLRVAAGEDPSDVFQEEFGLEADYALDLI